VLDATNHVARAISSRDAEEFLACWSRRLRFVDHRTIGWDTGGYERMRERFRSLNPDDERPRDRVRAEIVAIHHLEPPVLCHTGSHTVTTATGAELQERHVIVSRIDPATGQIELLEEYPDDQVDTALDRCSELAQEERVGANDAVFVGGAANRRARSADLDGWASIVAPAYELVVEHGDGARRTTVRDAFVRGSVALHEAGFGVDDRRIVEVRHDRLALLELRGAGPPAQPAIAGELRARHTTTADTTTGHTTTADTRTADDDPAIVDQLRARHTTTADTTTADYMTTGHTTTADDTTAHTTTAGDDPGDVPGDDVVIGYVVDELDDAGRLLRTTRFDPGSLAAARAHLERRAGSTGRARDQVDTAAPGRQVRSR
jgi:hypothetical protein